MQAAPPVLSGKPAGNGGNGGAVRGGGIYLASGQLTVIDSIINDNAARGGVGGAGGAGIQGGAPGAAGAVGGNGGNGGSAAGGAIYQAGGSVRLSSSVVADAVSAESMLISA